MPHPIQFRGRFNRVHSPTNSVKQLKTLKGKMIRSYIKDQQLNEIQGGPKKVNHYHKSSLNRIKTRN